MSGLAWPGAGAGSLVQSPVTVEEVASRSAARAVGCVPGLHRHLKLVPETYIWIYFIF